MERHCTYAVSGKDDWARRARLVAIGGVFAIIGALAAGCSSGADVDERPSFADVDKGQAIAELVCSTCHAIGREDTGPHPDATPFRDISKNYPIDMLADSLSRGIIVDHPDMPPFSFPQDEVDALIGYMKRIQSPHET